MQSRAEDIFPNWNLFWFLLIYQNWYFLKFKIKYLALMLLYQLIYICISHFFISLCVLFHGNKTVPLHTFLMGCFWPFIEFVWLHNRLQYDFSYKKKNHSKVVLEFAIKAQKVNKSRFSFVIGTHTQANCA